MAENRSKKEHLIEIAVFLWLQPLRCVGEADRRQSVGLNWSFVFQMAFYHNKSRTLSVKKAFSQLNGNFYLSADESAMCCVPFK